MVKRPNSSSQTSGSGTCNGTDRFAHIDFGMKISSANRSAQKEDSICYIEAPREEHNFAEQQRFSEVVHSRHTELNR
jgi:hypothetical protein